MSLPQLVRNIVLVATTVVVLRGCSSAIQSIDLAIRPEENDVNLKDKLPVLVEQLLFSPGEKTIDLLFSNFEPLHSVFWVDWGGEEFDIVEACAKALGLNSLATKPDTSEPPKLLITYNARDFSFPKDMTTSAQHTTLVRLNHVLSPDYQIRMIWESEGSDSLAMVVLDIELWSEIEGTVGKELVNKVFLKFTEDLDLFNTDISPLRP